MYPSYLLHSFSSFRFEATSFVFLYYYLTNSVFGRPNGSSTFQISRENIKSDVHPKRGDVVTFSCETYSTKGTPVNPQVFRTRKDVTWESVLLEYAESSETRGNTRSFENGMTAFSFSCFWLCFSLCVSSPSILNFFLIVNRIANG